MKPSEYLQKCYNEALPNRVNALGIKAIANACQMNTIEALHELIMDAPLRSQERGGYPEQIVSGMWLWRVKNG